LLGALKNFLHNEREKARALRRGGGLPPLSIDQARAESGFAFEPHHNRTPETVYLRQWALAVLNETLSALRGRYEADGKGALFERLHPFIAGEKEGGSYRTIGEELGMSEDSIKMAVSRLRRDSSSGVRSARDRTT
jgi:RNA polymerase sigma-70 factor (ECF subfamily)